MKNKTIRCQHCNSTIGREHEVTEKRNSPTVVVPLKRNIIIKVTVEKASETERYGEMETTHGFKMNTKIRCSTCHKNTTVSSLVLK